MEHHPRKWLLFWLTKLTDGRSPVPGFGWVWWFSNKLPTLLSDPELLQGWKSWKWSCETQKNITARRQLVSETGPKLWDVTKHVQKNIVATSCNTHIMGYIMYRTQLWIFMEIHHLPTQIHISVVSPMQNTPTTIDSTGETSVARRTFERSP